MKNPISSLALLCLTLLCSYGQQGPITLANLPHATTIGTTNRIYIETNAPGGQLWGAYITPNDILTNTINNLPTQQGVITNGQSGVTLSGLIDTNPTTGSYSLYRGGWAFWTNAVTGSWVLLTNGAFTLSNAGYPLLTFTNGQVPLSALPGAVLTNNQSGVSLYGLHSSSMDATNLTLQGPVYTGTFFPRIDLVSRNPGGSTFTNTITVNPNGIIVGGVYITTAGLIFGNLSGNASTATLATNVVGVLSPTNLPSGLSSSNYVGTYIGNAAGLTNLNAGALTNTGSLVISADKVTSGNTNLWAQLQITSQGGTTIVIPALNPNYWSNSLYIGPLWTNTIGPPNPVDPLTVENNGSVNGLFNTFIGYGAAISNSAGNENVFIGSGTGQNNVNGVQNTYVGAFAGQFQQDGYHNTYLGAWAGDVDVHGYYNVVVGTDAGLWATNFTNCVMVGTSSGSSNAAFGNTYVGTQAAQASIIGGSNAMVGTFAGGNMQLFSSTALGYNAMRGATVGATNASYSVALGAFAGFQLLSISNSFLGGDHVSATTTNITNSVIIGTQAGYNGAYHSADVGIGNMALDNCLTYENVAIGQNAMYGSGAANLNKNNVSVGYQSGYSVAGAAYETLLGSGAGYNVSSGWGNTFIGAGVDGLAAGVGYTLNVGNLIYGTNQNVSGGTGLNTPLAGAKVGIGRWPTNAMLEVAGGVAFMKQTNSAPLNIWTNMAATTTYWTNTTGFSGFAALNGTVTSVSLNGTTIFTSAPATIPLAPGGYVTIGYTGTPTMYWIYQ